MKKIFNCNRLQEEKKGKKISLLKLYAYDGLHLHVCNIVHIFLIRKLLKCEQKYVFSFFFSSKLNNGLFSLSGFVAPNEKLVA